MINQLAGGLSVGPAAFLGIVHGKTAPRYGERMLRAGVPNTSVRSER
jgi:hypothetical protein